MPSNQRRILELALESLQIKKMQIEEEIAGINDQLREKYSKKVDAPKPKAKAGAGSGRKQPRFSKEERLRRSQRMKAYWENWRKKRSRQK
jgi:hypothetical protein